jgi:DNA repair protein RadA/Sms
MPKVTTKYICQSCGYEAPRWIGKCPECGAFSTFSEEKVAPVARSKGLNSSRASSDYSGGGGSRPQALSAVESTAKQRLSTGISEFDRVLGGGLVPGCMFPARNRRSKSSCAPIGWAWPATTCF